MEKVDSLEVEEVCLMALVGVEVVGSNPHPIIIYMEYLLSPLLQNESMWA